ASLFSQAQGSILSALLETTAQSSKETIQKEMNGFILALQEKKNDTKNEVRFLRSLVNKSHRKFLKHYQAYAQFNQVFETGTYDCLSGTAFFSVVLDQLGYSYKIIETNYHIFLLVSTEQGEVLLETTDRLAGLKTSAQEINQTLAIYKQNRLSASVAEANYYLYQTQLFREVDAIQLSGLLYFNQAVVAYNQQKWSLCANQLAKARKVYDNPRVEELSEILFKSIVLSEMEQTVKKELLQQLKPFVKTSPLVASR
ncbi:MAG: hypothetical protein HOP30_12980, partial [Cyclobacteriaceae bacterium]|nr:hypothetical protein [Cyclobacteriaceae bacterium]